MSCIIHLWAVPLSRAVCWRNYQITYDSLYTKYLLYIKFVNSHNSLYKRKGKCRGAIPILEHYFFYCKLFSFEAAIVLRVLWWLYSRVVQSKRQASVWQENASNLFAASEWLFLVRFLSVVVLYIKKKLLLCLLAGKRSLVAYGVFYTSILNKKAARVGRQPGLWIRGANLGPKSVVAIKKKMLPCRKESICIAMYGAPLSQGKASQKLGKRGASV